MVVLRLQTGVTTTAFFLASLFYKKKGNKCRKQKIKARVPWNEILFPAAINCISCHES